MGGRVEILPPTLVFAWRDRNGFPILIVEGALPRLYRAMKTGQLLLTIGLLMLVSGLVLPFVVGSALSPTVYNILQLGGIALAIVGAIVRVAGK